MKWLGSVAGNEQGFSLVEAGVVFVVIVLLATIAGLVTNRQAAKQDQQLRPNTLQLSTIPSTKKPSPTSTANTTTFELAAIGINITVPNALNDLTYGAPAPRSDGYGLSTKTLTNLDDNCSAVSDNPPLGYFFKASGQYPANGRGPGRLVKQFAAFYIAWAAAAAPCSSNSSVMLLASQQQQNLEDSFMTIEESAPTN
jgi:hypothetical protein